MERKVDVFQSLRQIKLAKNLLKGKGVDKNEVEAVSILEDCVALGNTEAMLMLAECCYVGRGIKRDMERAQALISESAKNGNETALSVLKLIDTFQSGGDIIQWSLECTDINCFWFACFKTLFFLQSIAHVSLQ